MNGSAKPHLLGLVAGLFLAAGLVVSSMLATAAWLKVRNTQFVTVKGSARKNIKSDLVVWRGAFTVEATNLVEAQNKLRNDRAIVDGFLAGAGITNFALTPITIEEVKATVSAADNTFSRQQTAGYRLTQSVRVESSDTERILSLDRSCIGLVEKGVLFTTHPLEFIYTKAGEAKIEMLAEATKDARTRAEQIAGQGGRELARMHNADMGVIQIAPLYSGETSWDGMNDKSSLDKTITAVITATFALK